MALEMQKAAATVGIARSRELGAAQREAQADALRQEADAYLKQKLEGMGVVMRAASSTEATLRSRAAQLRSRLGKLREQGDVASADSAERRATALTVEANAVKGNII
eukprot:7229500-Prymnesium_polylepis.1